MINVSQEKIKERYEALPTHLREYMTSLETSEAIAVIAESHHLNDEKTKQVSSAVGAVLLGFLRPEHLREEIAERLNISAEHAGQIAEAVNRKIIAPVLADIEAVYGQKGTVPNEPETHKPQEKGKYLATENAGASDHPAGDDLPFKNAPAGKLTENNPQNSTESAGTKNMYADEGSFPEQVAGDDKEEKPSPYFLHKQKQGIERVKSPVGDDSLMRPYFFEPNVGAEMQNAPTEARLELGGEYEEEKSSPGVGKVGEEKPRIIHYSKPKTELDPFGAHKKENNESNGVHPDNVVDLKKPTTND